MQVGSTWKYVCDDYFDNNNNGANVACRELGYTSGTHTNGYAPYSSFYDDVQCVGTEARLVDCSRTNGHNCGSSEAVTLHCHAPISTLHPTNAPTNAGPPSLAHCNMSATTGGMESTFWYANSHQSPATGSWLDENNHPHPQPITFMRCPDNRSRTRQPDVSPAACELALESAPGSKLMVNFKLIESDNNLGVQVYDGLSAISESVCLPFELTLPF